MKFWIFDLEPYEERYTAQMRMWVEKTFDERRLNYEFITPKIDYHNPPEEYDGTRTDTMVKTIERGTVLDAVGTNYYKAKQIAWFMSLINEGPVAKGDVVFVFDFQFPGLEAIRYTSDLLGLDLKIYAVCHASSYTHGDFTEPMEPWLVFFEHGWWSLCDGIFVGTEYHKQAIIFRRDGKRYEDKIHVTGNAFNSESVRDLAGEMIPPNKRKYDIIFSNRWDIEKNPGDFVSILELLTDFKFGQKEKLNILITTSRNVDSSNFGSDQTAFSRLSLLKMLGENNNIPLNIEIHAGLSKGEYYKMMGDSKVYVSTSHEENFGYCLVEALSLGCHPVVPAVASHIELTKANVNYLYADLAGAAEKIRAAITKPQPMAHLAMEYDDSVDRMISIMLGEDPNRIMG